MKDQGTDEDQRIRSVLDKHSTNENPVAYVLEKSSAGITYVMRLDDLKNFPTRKPTKKKRHNGIKQ